MTERERRKRRKRRQLERERQVRRMKQRIAMGIGAIVLLIVVILVFRSCTNSGSDSTGGDTSGSANGSESLSQNEIAVVTPSQEEISVSGNGAAVSVTLSFTGDCTIGTDENFDEDTSFNAYYESYGEDYFLENVREVFEADDLTAINLESVLTTLDTREDKTFAFKADPSYVNILTSSSVELANIANNHSHDYGNDSYQETKDTLKEAGISYFGNQNLALEEVNGVTVGFSGVYELPYGTECEDDLKDDIALLKEYGADIVVVEFHWGNETETIPDEDQVYLGHAAIDAGADLVVGAHPHVLQGIEIYEDKPIVYSMGNFCFGGNSNPSEYETMIYQQTFTLQNGEITDSQMNIIPCSLSSSDGYNDYKPVILEGEEAEDVLDLLQKRSDEAAEEYGTEAAVIATAS